MKSKQINTDDGPIHIDRTFIARARIQAQHEAWMWRYHTGIPRDGWQQYANCRGMDPRWFYNDENVGPPPPKVLQACAHCPVRADCGRQLVVEEPAIDPNTIHGTRAGMTARTRERLYSVMARQGLR